MENTPLFSTQCKTGTWHQAREAEPKDYNIYTDPKRDLHRSSYHRFSLDDTFFCDTTYGSEISKIIEEPYQRQVDLKALSAFESFFSPTTLSEFQKHLRKPPNNQKNTYCSIYQKEFRKELEKPLQDPADVSPKIPEFRRMISQFTEHGGHRRFGRNTWADESGVYANTHLRRQLDASADHMSHIIYPDTQDTQFPARS